MNDSKTWSTPVGLAREGWIKRLTMSDCASATKTGWGLLDAAQSAVRNGKLELARVLLERLVAQLRDSWKDPVSLAIATNELAFVVAQQGDLSRAERLYGRIYKIWLRLSPLSCPAAGRRIFAYTQFLHDYKQFLLGFKRENEAASVQAKLEVLGLVFSTGSLLTHIADTHALRGRYRDAQLAYEQAFRCATISKDTDLKGMLTMRLTLSFRKDGIPLSRLIHNRITQDCSLKATLLPERRKLEIEDFSPDGGEVLWHSYLDSAQNCCEQGLLTDAEGYFRKALAQSRSLSEGTGKVSQTLVKMGLFYAKHPGKCLEAEDSFKRALKIAETNRDCQSVKTICTHLAKFYSDYGRTLESANLMSRLQALIPLNQTVSAQQMRLPQLPDGV